MMKMIDALGVVLFMACCVLSGCVTSTSPTVERLGPPLALRGTDGVYRANPAATLPCGVTINPATGALVYPATWGR